jgi:hypothetical protein
MIRSCIVLSLMVIFFTLTTFAQTAGALSRTKVLSTRFQKQHMKQTEEMLINGLKDNDPLKRATSAQNIRDLEFVYPEEPFSAFLTPLVETLKNENEVTQVRILSAIALDQLHSETGDQVIEDVAKISTNQSVKELCTALLVKTHKD